jgi:Tol biopolymer transport system component
MPLVSGTRFGPYEIRSPLGAGGMGEVYRARDTRLERTVAIKILPAQFSSDPIRKQRFEREAKTISSLNHPHICTLHDIGHQDGVDYLVMECVEGETLATRLEKGPLPLDQALKYGAQIADALDKAHSSGVVHRDLKPGNIMLTKTGVKLLDFGLAKATTEVMATSLTEVSTAPTQSRTLTAEGTILGTLHYMAPEQLEGRDADARSDIFALGEVLYEMGTGRQAFQGKSRASVIAAILSSAPPPMSTLQPMTPPALDGAVKRCLAKDPEERWQSARDLVLELRWIAEAGAAEAPVRRPRLAWLGVVVALAAALGLALIHFNRATKETRAVRFSVSLPENTSLISGRVSPDGRYLSFAGDSGGQTQLWLRPLDALAARPLPGTEGARSVHFWSPDSRFIGFIAERKLKKIDVTGGPPQVLCDAPGAGPFQFGSWNSDGTILFNVAETPGREGLYRVSAAGGPATRVTLHDESGKELQAFWPSFLPDGRHFVFACGRQRQDGALEPTGICVASLDSGQARKLLDTTSYAEYAPPGYLLYVRDAALFAHPFDPDKLRLHGDPIRIVERVATVAGIGLPSFSTGVNGLLAYHSGGGSQSRLVWKDRKGAVVGQVGTPAEYGDLRLSPDGQKLAVPITDPQAGTTDLWLIELSRNLATRFTLEGADVYNPIWSPDGSRIVFSVPRHAPPFLHQKAVSGGEREVLLPSNGTMHVAFAWSPDGRFILYGERNPDTNWDLWVLPLDGERKPLPFLRTRFREGFATFSPDGRWVAFVSDESGRLEVYVQPFQRPGEKHRASTAGGSLPRWRRDGKELFYVSPDNQLMAVPVQLGASFESGTPKALFSIEASQGVEISYDVAADGQRFIINSPIPGTAAPPTVVLNWVAELPR